MDKQARKEWERIFNEHYIHPVLSSLDDNLTIAMDRVANDDNQGIQYSIDYVYFMIVHLSIYVIMTTLISPYCRS